MKTATDLSDAIERARQGQRVMCICPNHDDSTPSLSVAPGTNQPVTLKCFGGCETEDILAASGMTWADISNPLEERGVDPYWTPNGRASDIYPYHLHDGTVEFEVLRIPTDKGKRISQRRPDGNGGYIWNLDGVTRVPYRLPHVIEAVQAGHTIHIAEGEKCVHALLSIIPPGDEATTNSGGAGRWRHEYGNWMAGANVVVYADADDAGREHAREVRESLLEHGCFVTILETPAGRLKDGRPIKDIADHVEAGLSLNSLLETTPGSEAVRVRSAIDVLNLVERPEWEFEFVIPDVLAKAERLLLVGLEGRGKSEFLRQIAVCCAAGVHPFTGIAMPPRRVLMIDAENHPGQTLGPWKRMVRAVQRDGHLEPGMLQILEEWDSNIDLASMGGRAWLKERIRAYAPELLILGPLKNLTKDNLSAHETVSSLRWTINEARSICESAVIMEHHAPLRMTGDRERELRPYGSGLFLGWPDFGYAMKPTEHEGVFEWQAFRGDRVRGRNWPDSLRWGKPNEYSWVPCLITEDGEVVG